MQEILEYILKNLVNHPDDLKITVENAPVENQSNYSSENASDNPGSPLEYVNPSDNYSHQYYKPKVTYIVNANQEDIPLIIGKGGRTIRPGTEEKEDTE